MLTLKHLKIYLKHGGDGDNFVRNGTDEEKLIMDSKNWSLIENLKQDMYLGKKNLASELYVKKIEIILKRECENEETINELKKIHYFPTKN